jgi:hypothetical protein
MASDDFHNDARALMERLLQDAPDAGDREMLLEVYAQEMTNLHRLYAHSLLTDVINDARTRLDARLSPDPIRQTIATVQTTVQDLWKSLWQ